MKILLSSKMSTVLQRKENMNCAYICRSQKSAAILPPACAEGPRKKALNVFPLLRDEHNLNGLLKGCWDFQT